MGLPSIDLDAIHDADIRQAYFLLFEHMKDDFVTKRDLQIMLAGATAPPPDFIVKYVPLFIIGDIMAVVYKLAAKGLAAGRNALISGLESTLG